MDSPVRKTLVGYGLMLLAIICWVSSEASVQLLKRRVPDFELGLLRYIGAMLCAALAMCFNKRTELKIPKESYVHVLLLGLCMTGFNFLYFFAVAFVPLSHVSFSLVCIMIVTAVIMKLLCDKTPNISMVISIIGCALGMVFLVQPWKDFNHGFTPGFLTSAENITISQDNSTSYEPVASGFTWALALGYLAFIGAAVFESFYVILAGVYLNNVKPALLIFLISGVALPINLICSFYLEQPVWITDPYSILLVSIHVVATTVAELCQIAACQLISPTHIAIATNLTPVLSLIPQYTILSDYLYGRRNVLEVSGCLLIVASITQSGLFNNDKKHEYFNRFRGSFNSGLASFKGWCCPSTAQSTIK